MTSRTWASAISLAEPCFFRDDSQGKSSQAGEEKQKRLGRKLLYCCHCHAPVTDQQAMLAIDGQCQHTFANPAGIVFEIGCFGGAPGCLRRGRPTAEFSWFPPYAWSLALCAHCHAHLGWFYEADGLASFYGLILARLVQE